MSSNGKAVAIIQSNYIPWKGYFDVIDRVDEFIFLDDVQYTTRDWRNRNRIKTRDGVKWLTIPVEHGSSRRTIAETVIGDDGWAERHWKSIVHAYAAAPHFASFKEPFEQLYLTPRESRLSAVNRRFVSTICTGLGIGTPLRQSSDYRASGTGSERILTLCQAAGATRYVSGPAARAYLDEGAFRSAGIDVAWMDYSGYLEYPQLHPPFEHEVSVLDLIFNTGPRRRVTSGGRRGARLRLCGRHRDPDGLRAGGLQVDSRRRRPVPRRERATG